jgi:hypothetical protein
MTNNKRKYGNDKFQSGPLSDQPEINTGLLPGSQEVYVESNVDKSTKSSFLKDIPNWLKWLLVAVILLLAFWVWNNRSNDDSVVTSESTTTTVIPQTTTTTIPDPLDPNYFEPHLVKINRYIDKVREAGWFHTSGPRKGKSIDTDFTDMQLVAMGWDTCDMLRLAWSNPRIIDYLVSSNTLVLNSTSSTSLYEVYLSNLVYSAQLYLCPEVIS